jgi:hypothetical protein
MPNKLDQLIAEINADDGYGICLMAQMDSVPDTLQFIIATTYFDEAVGGLRDKARYIVRAIGVQEHRISVGMFRRIAVHAGEEHPLLYEYNSLPTGLFFKGTPNDVNGLIIDVFQAYSSTFSLWRHLPQYLNVQKPMADLFMGGGDLVGQMPKPLADRLEKVLVHHGLEAKVLAGEKHKEAPNMKTLLLDESYIVAIDFSVDELGKA